MSGPNLPLVMKNAGHVAWNRVARMRRQWARQWQRTAKQLRERGKRVRAALWGGLENSKDVGRHAYTGTVRTTRYWRRVQQQSIPRVQREIAVRRELRAAGRGDGPIIVGPWLSEVGYEVLYWVPFLRWFCDRYQVDRQRLVVVSRGGVAGWYHDVAAHYVELLDLFDLSDFAARNAARQLEGEQKQHGIAAFDREILSRVRERPEWASAQVCHPSAMFRLLRQFWLGNESLSYVSEHTRYARASVSGLPPAPPLPERFIAVKFYTGTAIADTAAHRRQLRDLVEHLARQAPIVTLDTGVAIDEHQDFLFKGVPGVTDLNHWLTPQNNLGLQTAVVARASSFVSTCGGLAWLAPFLGTPTCAVYADDQHLTPHLYAARQAYRATNAAPFTPVDLRSLDLLGVSRQALEFPR